jgi:hypothetical protein
LVTDQVTSSIFRLSLELAARSGLSVYSAVSGICQKWHKLDCHKQACHSCENQAAGNRMFGLKMKFLRSLDATGADRALQIAARRFT